MLNVIIIYPSIVGIVCTITSCILFARINAYVIELTKSIAIAAKKIMLSACLSFFDFIPAAIAIPTIAIIHEESYISVIDSS